MQSVTLARTPFGSYLVKCVQEARDRLLLMCPFIKVDVVNAILARVSEQVDILTLTRLEKADVVRGASDIEALDKLMNRGEVRRNPKVHAKLLIADEKVALISSANLSSSGLYYNFECGVLIDEPGVIASAVSFFDEVWNDLYTTALTKSDLKKMRRFAYSEYRLMDTFEKFIAKVRHKGVNVARVNKLFQTYVKSVEEEQEKEIVCEVVTNWIEKDTQPAKIVKMLVLRSNEWVFPKEVSQVYAEIKDPGTVMYDLAQRGSEEYYLRRPRYYPRSFSIEPILQHDERKGYRIKTRFFEAIMHTVRELLPK